MAKVIHHSEPFIVDKNLGSALDLENAQLTATTADGTPVVAPTQEQKYLFDMRGWLLVPGVLSGDELAEMQEFGHRLRQDPASIPEHERSPLGGPLQRLSDHPKRCRLSQRVPRPPCTIRSGMLRVSDGVV